MTCTRFFSTTILLALLPIVAAGENLNILAIGQVLPGESPLDVWFEADPLVDYVLVPTEFDFTASFPVGSQEEAQNAWRRFIRTYFPKTRKALVEGFDFLVFPDGNLNYFTARQIANMKYAIEEGAGSFVTMGGGMAKPNVGWTPAWISSSMSDIFPIILTDKMRQDATSGFSIRVVKADPPVLSMFVPLGIEGVIGSYAFTLLYPQPGATTWGKLISHGSPLPADAPGDWLVSWRFGSGGGLSWVVADDLDSTWWSSVHFQTQNEYAGDVFFNILLHSTGRSLPENIFIIHDLRGRYLHYNRERGFLLSLLDFIDRFGANTRDVERQMGDIERLRVESYDAYREADFQRALELVDEAFEMLVSISTDAMRLKDNALLWVYLTEWLVVTGALLFSGSAIYSLMIRRKLYRDVAVTRLQGGE